MLELYGFARVNKGAHGKTRDLRVLWALEENLVAYRTRCIERPAWKKTFAAYSDRVEAA